MNRGGGGGKGPSFDERRQRYDWKQSSGRKEKKNGRRPRSRYNQKDKSALLIGDEGGAERKTNRGKKLRVIHFRNLCKGDRF